MTSKLCACGCGLSVTSATFVRGHNTKNNQSPLYTGDTAGYRAIHTYVNKHFPKSGICEECKEVKRTDYALIKDHSYSRNREDYRELCKRCHNAYDEIGGSRWRNVVTAKQTAGEAPLCKCGCGNRVEWNRKHARWFAFHRK